MNKYFIFFNNLYSSTKFTIVELLSIVGLISYTLYYIIEYYR